MNDLSTESCQRQLARLSKIGVLLVDNDQKILDLLKTVLERLGFRSIYTARDGLGVQVLEDHARAIAPITTDWELAPPTDGAGFVRYLRSAPTYKGPDRRRRKAEIPQDRRKIDIKVIKYAG